MRYGCAVMGRGMGTRTRARPFLREGRGGQGHTGNKVQPTTSESTTDEAARRDRPRGLGHATGHAMRRGSWARRPVMLFIHLFWFGLVQTDDARGRRGKRQTGRDRGKKNKGGATTTTTTKKPRRLDIGWPVISLHASSLSTHDTHSVHNHTRAHAHTSLCVPG